MTDETAGRSPATRLDEPAVGLEGLTEEVLPALIARLRASRLGELEIRTAEWRVRLRRDPNAKVRPSTTAAPGSERTGAEDLNGSVARSTAVGYFMPGAALVVGATVQAGDVLGTIDVLGVSQEVAAPQDGVVSSVLAEDGQAVEYGQALAEIDPLEPYAGDDEDLA